MHSHPHAEPGKFLIYSKNSLLTRTRTAWLSVSDVVNAKRYNMIIGVVVPNYSKSIQIAYVRGSWGKWQSKNPNSTTYINQTSYDYDNMLLEKLR